MHKAEQWLLNQIRKPYPSQNITTTNEEAKPLSQSEVKKPTEDELELIKHIAGHLDELTTTHIGIFKDELLELSGSSETDLEDLLTHFPSCQLTYFSFKPYGPKYTTLRISIKPYCNNSSDLMLLMLALISCSNFKWFKDEKLTHNATMVMMIKLNKQSDEYLFKNEADKREFGSMALEYVAEYIIIWWSLKELGEIDEEEEYDEEY
jgi:hypothetical protein